MYKHFVKRLLDIVLSIIGIAVLAIPMVIVAVCIRIDSKGPVLFKQRRIGLHKREFMILKFRSMPTTVPKDIATHQMDMSSIEMTRLQKLIRRYSIDELPQLFNILAGHCSIIGPRPALFNQYDLIEERDKYGANDVKPGLSGLAQINGRDELDIVEKAKLDGDYTRELNSAHFRGFAMDVKCFFGTVRSVLKHEGVAESDMSESSKTQEKEKAKK